MKTWESFYKARDVEKGKLLKCKKNFRDYFSFRFSVRLRQYKDDDDKGKVWTKATRRHNFHDKLLTFSLFPCFFLFIYQHKFLFRLFSSTKFFIFIFLSFLHSLSSFYQTAKINIQKNFIVELDWVDLLAIFPLANFHTKLFLRASQLETNSRLIVSQ